MAHLRGVLIAPRALQWLASAYEPRIHSLYRQSINIIDPDQGLLSVVLPGLGPGPFAVVAEPLDNDFAGFDHLALETAVETTADSIRFAEVHIDWSAAEQWQPVPDWHAFGEAMNGARAAQLAALLHKHAPPNSFAPLTSANARRGDEDLRAVDSAGEAVVPSFSSQALSAAAGPAKVLESGLAEGDLSQIRKAAEGLAGLGGGVTPSGDDLLQGTIHAVWAKLGQERGEGWGGVIVSAAAPRTNVISGEWLKAAARGESSADWHSLAESLGAERDVEQAAIHLIRRGHTSGADALAGFLSALGALGT